MRLRKAANSVGGLVPHERTGPAESRVALRRKSRRSGRQKVIAGALSVLAGVGVVSVLTAGAAAAVPSPNDWFRLRMCESTNNYAINTGNGYYGAYQFDLSTWRSVGGTGLPSNASPATQDALALRLWWSRGWSPWACSSIVGLFGGPAAGSVPPAAPPPAPVNRAPVGVLDPVLVASSRTTATVHGWAFDPNATRTSLTVTVTVNGAARRLVAAAPRPDVDRIFRIAGGHGFVVTAAVHLGLNTVCATALDATSGSRSLGCRSVRVVGLVVGHVDAVRVARNHAVVSGWALDRNLPNASISAHVYVNGQGYPVTASGSRPDVARIMGVAPRHGFSALVNLRPGVNNICSYAIGAAGRQGFLGCRSVRLPAPFGHVDKVAVAPGRRIMVAGWTVDPNASASSIRAHIYINGTGYSVPAAGARADVDRAFRVTGGHGFAINAPGAVGRNTVCAYGIGTLAGNNTLLSCRVVVVP